MEENKTIETISHNAVDSDIAFPLDYSQSEIANTYSVWDGDRSKIHRTTFREIVCDSGVFKKFFRWVRYDSPDGGVKRSNAIPAELFSFFRVFLQQVMSEISFTKRVRDNKIPEEMGTLFYKQLLEFSQREEHKENHEDSELYWTRILYQNAAFQDWLVQELWENEYMLRIRKLSEMVRTLTPEQQLDMFCAMINHLDNEIVTAFRLQKANNNGSKGQNKTFENFLFDFPKAVVSQCRKKKVIGEDPKKVVYITDNFPLSSPVRIDWIEKGKEQQYTVYTLEDVFRKVCGNKKGSVTIKKAARKDYFRRLNQKAVKSQFQMNYEYSLSYLNVCFEDGNLIELKQQISDRAAVYFGAVFRGENALPGVFRLDQNGVFPQGEVNGMIESLVLGYYNYFCTNHSNWAFFIQESMRITDRSFNWMKNHARLLEQDPHFAENEELFKRETQMYFEHLKEIMPIRIAEKFVVGESVPEEQICGLAEEIVEMSRNASAKLGFSTPDWADVNRIVNAIQRYNTMLSAKNGGASGINYPGFWETDVNLRQAFISCKYEEAADDCCKETEKYILELSEVIKEMKENNCK